MNHHLENLATAALALKSRGLVRRAAGVEVARARLEELEARFSEQGCAADVERLREASKMIGGVAAFEDASIQIDIAADRLEHLERVIACVLTSEQNAEDRAYGQPTAAGVEERVIPVRRFTILIEPGTTPSLPEAGGIILLGPVGAPFRLLEATDTGDEQGSWRVWAIETTPASLHDVPVTGPAPFAYRVLREWLAGVRHSTPDQMDEPVATVKLCGSEFGGEVLCRRFHGHERGAGDIDHLGTDARGLPARWETGSVETCDGDPREVPADGPEAAYAQVLETGLLS